MIGESRQAEGQGGHNYLASVSDLVSALIFVFIIMLAVFAYQLANVTRKQEERVEDLEAEEKTRTRMLRDIKNRLEESRHAGRSACRPGCPAAVGQCHQLSVR